MEVGVSTACFFNRVLCEDSPALLRLAGAGLGEIFLNTFREYEPCFIALLKERTEEQGIRIISVHPQSTQFEPQLFSVYERQQKDALAVYRKVLQAAQTLGARYYVMHGSLTLGGAAKNLQIKRMADNYRMLCNIASDYGIQLTQENVSWCANSYPEFGLHLQEEMGSQDLKFTLDCKQAVRAGYDPMRFIETLGGQIVHWHLCDYAPRREGGYFWRLPGQGICDFAALATALRLSGYQGAGMLEVYSDMYADMDELKACRDYLEKQLDCI